jgi:chemotaxis family two-component system sensor histidine kinase/response regulator PixL
MITDPTIRDQAYQYFLEEAPELLETIEQELFAINEESLNHKERPLRVNKLMRATHTLKGGAANVGLETIKTVAHSLEDVFKALYNPELGIDIETKKLLYESYECLREPLIAEFSQVQIDHSDILDRAATVFAQLQAKFGDYLTDQDAFPTSEELGLDVVESFFREVIPDRLQELSTALAENNANEVAIVLRSQAEIFLGLAESLNLPGFGKIAKTILAALDRSPERALEITQMAIANLQQAQKQILDGDRTSGGEPSAALKQLAFESSETNQELFFDAPTGESLSSDTEEGNQNQANSQELMEEIWGKEDQFSEDLSKTDDEFLDEVSSHSTTETISDHDEQLESSELIQTIWGEESQAESSSPDNPAQNTLVRTKDHYQLAVSTPETATEISATQFVSSAKGSTAKVPATQTVRVNLESLERLNNLVGELLINQNRNVLKDEQIASSVQELLERINYNEQIINQIIDLVDAICLSPQQQKILQELPEKLQKLAVSLPERDQPILSQTNLLSKPNQRLSQEMELSNLLHLATESNLELARIAEQIKNFNKQACRDTQKQQRMLLNMRDELIETRMSPIGRIFNRFPRLLTQLSTSYGKPVDLKLFGSHILVDKTIEEKLYDPLLHLVRNAFDHGIESVDERRQYGKTERGKIELRAYYHGSQTVIEVRDDGKGINLAKIKQRGLELNLISPEQANNSSSAQILELLFEPGFSTASKVSDLSGRGVGLDIVRAQVEEMNGTLQIESTPQQGTTFALKVPLTLTIAKLMLTQAGSMTYAISIDAIERIVLPTSHQIKTFENQKILHWPTDTENQMIPVRRLSSLIEYSRIIRPVEPIKDNNVSNPILLLRRQNGLLGLEVDQVLGEQELVIRPLGGAIAPPSFIYGCSILKDSRLTLVIDSVALLNESQLRKAYHNSYQSKSQQAFLTSSQPKELPSGSNQQQKLLPPSSVVAQTLLVVDDSSSLRHSISQSLQKISDRVLQAENGLKALEKLHQAGEVGLVVCDLEMPFMNGFQFLKAIRQNTNFGNIPVIILTSRDSEKHHSLALELGANAYLTKPYDEQELLGTIVNIIHQKSIPAQSENSFSY